MGKVLAIVEEVSTRLGSIGWFDQYFFLMDGLNMKNTTSILKVCQGPVKMELIIVKRSQP